MKSEVNKYKQQAKTAQDKLKKDGPLGATKPTSKTKLCNHFKHGKHCSYDDKCGFLHCNPNDPDRKPLPNHPKEGAGPDWPPPVSPKKAKPKAKPKGKAKSKKTGTQPKTKADPKVKPKGKAKAASEEN